MGRMLSRSRYFSASTRLWLGIGALGGLLTVIFSALTTHLDASFFAANGRDMARMADNILAWHSLALLIVALLKESSSKDHHFNIVGLSFLLGLILFCGAVFYTAITGLHPHFLPIAPIGGILLMLGWIYLILCALFVTD